jgi:tripartite-type tricarboxylate transporter receptor subunit TctC
MNRRKNTVVLIAALSFASVCEFALAQAFPVKPIRLVSMATGVADGLTRMMGQKLSESMGQAVVVDLQPAAGGAIGADQVARSTPDGYTLFVTYPDPMVLRHLLVKNVPYDTLKDFAFISMMIEAQVALAANPAVPASNLRELVDLAKSTPGKLTYGSNGVGTSFQMAVESLKLHTGTDILHVPFKSSPDAMAALLRGDINLIVAALGTGLPLHRAGKIKFLATVNDSRSSTLADLPTIREIVPGFSSPPYWTGVVGPVKLPAPILQRLNAEMNRAMSAPELRARANEINFTVVSLSPEQFRARVANEIAASARTAKAIGIEPE